MADYWAERSVASMVVASVDKWVAKMADLMVGYLAGRWVASLAFATVDRWVGRWAAMLVETQVVN